MDPLSEHVMEKIFLAQVIFVIFDMEMNVQIGPMQRFLRQSDRRW